MDQDYMPKLWVMWDDEMDNMIVERTEGIDG
jgi:hypothetical protein